MVVTPSSSISTLQTVKERMREKLNGSLKAVKLQTSLAAKIKTKTLNNSYSLKVSLKNNKALACALTAEKEKSKRLGNDNMFLQKEISMLYFQNALLRQNLSIVNKTLTDIDVFMNTNLSAAIKISSTMESSDRLSLNDTKGERFSQQSTFSLDENQCFRLTGVALRVPSSSVGQQKYTSDQTIAVSEENRLLVPPPPITVGEDREKDQLEAHLLDLSPKESLLLCIKDRSRESLSNSKVGDRILPLDEVFSPSNKIAQSGGFVTRRRKRSAVSHSRRLSTNDSNQAWGSSGTRRDSSPSNHWEMNTDFTILPEMKAADFGEAQRSVLQNRRSTHSHCSLLSEKLDTRQHGEMEEYPSVALYNERPMQSANQPELVLSEESDLQTSYLGQEKTVYEADMEMTASESAPIMAVLPKNKTRASKNKSCLPVSQNSTLRRVKAVREKTKKMWSSVDQEVNDLSSNSSEKGNSAKYTENSARAGHYDRRTYVISAPDVEDRFDSPDADPARSDCPAVHDVLESGTPQFPDSQVLDSEKTQLTLTLKKEYCTESGTIADIAPKTTKSKNIKEASKMECSSKKKRMYKKSKNRAQMTEENVAGSAEQIDSGKNINTMLSIDDKNLESKFRSEINVVSAPNDHPSTNDLLNICGLNYRRETVMIPEPSPLVSVTLNSSILIERNDTLVEPQHNVDSSAPREVPHKTKIQSGPIKSDCEGELCKPISDPQDLHDHKKPVPRCSRKKSSRLFSELDKRKTYILPSRENDLTGKAPLVRESFMNPTSSQSGKASKFPDIVTHKNDSFMLDMVSESILDDTMCSSFAEFPSANNPESNFSTDMSLKSVPALELPVPGDCNGELSSVTNKICVQDENGTYKSEINQQCKVEEHDMEIRETAIKPFQDLTNKSHGSTRLFCAEEESQGHARRRRNPVNYKEPKLGTKLRRGDFHTDTSFLSSPAKKGKGNRAGRRHKVKSEESRAEDA